MAKFIKDLAIATIGFFVGRWTMMWMTGVNVHEANKGDIDAIKIMDDYEELGATIERMMTKENSDES